MSIIAGNTNAPLSLWKADWSVCLQIALWTSGIVLLTLLINAPFIPKLLEWTGLVKLSPTKAKMHAKAVRAFIRHTKTLIQDLQNNDDELLRGKPSCKAIDGCACTELPWSLVCWLVWFNAAYEQELSQLYPLT